MTGSSSWRMEDCSRSKAIGVIDEESLWNEEVFLDICELAAVSSPARGVDSLCFLAWVAGVDMFTGCGFKSCLRRVEGFFIAIVEKTPLVTLVDLWEILRAL